MSGDLAVLVEVKRCDDGHHTHHARLHTVATAIRPGTSASLSHHVTESRNSERDKYCHACCVHVLSPNV